MYDVFADLKAFLTAYVNFSGFIFTMNRAKITMILEENAIKAMIVAVCPTRKPGMVTCAMLSNEIYCYEILENIELATGCRSSDPRPPCPRPYCPRPSCVASLFFSV